MHPLDAKDRKRQAQDVIAEEAQRCGMFYINQRWLGGLLTNFATIQRSLGRLRDLDRAPEPSPQATDVRRNPIPTSIVRSLRVLLIDDHNSALDAFDQRSRVRAIVTGVVDDGLRMKYVGRTADVKSGDTVITSGLDGIFPRGLLVGTVKKVTRVAYGMFLKISVKPAVDFRNLEQVLVITQSPPKLVSGTKSKG